MQNLKPVSLFAYFFMLAPESIFIKTHCIYNRCVKGPENILFAGTSLRLSARKVYRLGQWRDYSCHGFMPEPQTDVTRLEWVKWVACLQYVHMRLKAFLLLSLPKCEKSTPWLRICFCIIFVERTCRELIPGLEDSMSVWSQPVAVFSFLLLLLLSFLVGPRAFIMSAQF